MRGGAAQVGRSHPPVEGGAVGAVGLLRDLGGHDEDRVLPTVSLVQVDQPDLLRLLHVCLKDTPTQGHTLTTGPRPAGGGRDPEHLLDALVEELQAGVTVADEGALLDELGEHLGPGQLAVELLLRPLAGLEEAWGTGTGTETVRGAGPVAAAPGRCSPCRWKRELQSVVVSEGACVMGSRKVR